MGAISRRPWRSSRPRCRLCKLKSKAKILCKQHVHIHTPVKKRKGCYIAEGGITMPRLIDHLDRIFDFSFSFLYPFFSFHHRSVSMLATENNKTNPHINNYNTRHTPAACS